MSIADITVPGSDVVAEIANEDDLALATMRHSTAHLMAEAVQEFAKTGKVTPLGFWKVLDKRKMYRSKKYDNAPMPFMQRIDEYGIALHGGANPGYPASHGCVRMPMKFAEKLFGLTKLGTEVVIEG